MQQMKETMMALCGEMEWISGQRMKFASKMEDL
jgi:hypothetical protein